MAIRLNEFYDSATILVTGGTGFIGKVLIEKLLRSQNNIKKIYILIRSKKGKSSENRAKNDIFEKPIFAYLKEHNPNFLDKVRILDGDIIQPKLGLKQCDIDLILNEVNIVFQVAASINMGAPFKYNIKFNLYSVLELLKLCRQMSRLKSVVIVSTAYSNCNNKVIEEKMYKSPITAELALKMCEEIDDNAMVDMTKYLLNGLPNTYVLSKCIMESALLDYPDLPIVLFRPGIVASAFREPLPGWIDNYNASAGLVVLGGLGLVRVMLFSLDRNTSYVPVDFCVNAIICSAWHGVQERLKSDQPMIYNYACNDHQIKFTNLLNHLKKGEVQSERSIWKPTFVAPNNKYLRLFLFYILNLLPAMIMDIFLTISGNKFRVLRLYKEKIIPALNVYAYFCNREWVYKEENIQKMLSSLNEEEQILYPFDRSKVTYEEIFQNLVVGGKTFLLKEKMENNHKAQRWHKILNVIHYMFLFIFWSFMCWLLYKFFKCICL